MRLLEVALSSNPRLQGVRMASMDFTDWMETMRALFSLESCRQLLSLGLDDNKNFGFKDKVRRSKCINTTLGNFPALERLDLSYNLLKGALNGILPRLRLTYLNVTKCYLLEEDLQ